MAANPKNFDAVLVLDKDGNLVEVVPDSIEIEVKHHSKPFTWKIAPAPAPDNEITVTFTDKIAFSNWSNKSQKNNGADTIQGKLKDLDQPGKQEEFKYEVSDSKNHTIDPTIIIH